MTTSTRSGDPYPHYYRLTGFSSGRTQEYRIDGPGVQQVYVRGGAVTDYFGLARGEWTASGMVETEVLEGPTAELSKPERFYPEAAEQWQAGDDEPMDPTLGLTDAEGVLWRVMPCPTNRAKRWAGNPHIPQQIAWRSWDEMRFPLTATSPSERADIR